MTTSPKTSLICELLDEATLRPEHVSYFGSRLRHDVHEEILQLFVRRAQDGFTKGDLARRLDKRPEQITRWLAAPGNWTFDTAAALALGLGATLRVTAEPLKELTPSNHFHELAAYQPRSATPEPGTATTGATAKITRREHVDAG
jgi:hypothetical protein